MSELLEPYKGLWNVCKYFKKGVERLQSDGVVEYVNMKIDLHFETTLDAPLHNQFPDRFNQTLLEPIRFIQEEAVLWAKCWEMLLNTLYTSKSELSTQV